MTPREKGAVIALGALSVFLAILIIIGVLVLFIV